MIYLIYFFLSFIIASITFISISFYAVNQLEWFYIIPPYVEMPFPIIPERAYRAVDLHAEFEYNTDVDRHKLNAPDGLLIMDSNHKKSIIEDYAHNLAKEMIKSGFVEITDRAFKYDRNLVTLKVKVYKPE